MAMGNFDGVHLGHQSVLALASAAAAELSAALGVITFEPHPRRFFQPDATAFRLMSSHTRARRFQKLGLDHLYEIPFTLGLAGQSAEEFIQNVLAEGLGIKHLTVGADFRFGKDRTGTPDLLTEKGISNGFGTTIAPLVNDSKGNFSSSAIRRALSEGRPGDASRMLGHWHRIEGSVEKGFERGRDLGFPTANIPLTDLHLPKYGVYAVITDVLDGPCQGRFHGVASIGERPTFADNHIPNLEVYLFEFSGDLYGATLETALIEFLRPEIRFESVDALIEAMQADCVHARDILAKT